MLKSIKNLNRFEKCLWLVSVIVGSASFVMSGGRDWMSMAASLIGVTALIFIAKGDVLGQILTVVFSVFYAAISYRYRYYSEMITYIGMTAPIAVMSVITWLKNPYAEKQVKISSMTPIKAAALLVFTATVTVLFYFILKALETPNLFFSTVSIATSFAASSLMLLRSPYYAVAYAMNDLVLIVLWVLASISDISYLPMVMCFVMFFVNDMYGFKNWRIMKKEQKAAV